MSAPQQDIYEKLVEAGARAICRAHCPGAHPCDMDGSACLSDKCDGWFLYVDDTRVCLKAAFSEVENQGAKTMFVWKDVP